MTRRRVPPVTKAEAGAETRAALLEAGAALLREQPVGTVMDQVKAVEVARRADRTIGAFYHYWEDQTSYKQELLQYVLSPARMESTAATATSVFSDLQLGLPMEEIVRRNARANFDSVRKNPYIALFLALWGKQEHDEQVRELLHDQYQAITDHLVPMYQAFFDEHSLEPRPPFTIEMFAVAITALVEGLAVRAAVDPDAVPLDLPSVQSSARSQLDGQLDQGPWDLFSILVLALLPSITVPKVKRDSDLWLDHEDIRGVVRRLRETWEAVTGKSSLSDRPSVPVNTTSQQ